MTEAISSALSLMEAPLAQTGSELFQPSPQRTVINGIVHANHHAADERRIGLRFKNRFKRQCDPQPVNDRLPRLVRQRLRRLHRDSLATRRPLILNPRHLQNAWQQIEPIVPSQHTQKVGKEVTTATS